MREKIVTVDWSQTEVEFQLPEVTLSMKQQLELQRWMEREIDALFHRCFPSPPPQTTLLEMRQRPASITSHFFNLTTT